MGDDASDDIDVDDASSIRDLARCDQLPMACENAGSCSVDAVTKGIQNVHSAPRQMQWLAHVGDDDTMAAVMQKTQRKKVARSSAIVRPHAKEHTRRSIAESVEGNHVGKDDDGRRSIP